MLKNQEKSSEAEKYLKDNGYLYQSLKEMQSSIGRTLSGIKLILGAIGGISLLVAAFGIANTMNMSILERKKRNWSYEGCRCLCRRYKKDIYR